MYRPLRLQVRALEEADLHHTDPHRVHTALLGFQCSRARYFAYACAGK